MRALLHSSCILESGEHRGACFSFGQGGREGTEGGRGSIHPSPHAPTWGLIGPVLIQKNIPKQEEGCGFMTKQNTRSQRDTLTGASPSLPSRLFLSIYLSAFSFIVYQRKINWKVIFPDGRNDLLPAFFLFSLRICFVTCEQ